MVLVVIIIIMTAYPYEGGEVEGWKWRTSQR